MNYWLFKSEPDKWSWDQQVEAGVHSCKRTRNFQAQKNLKEMKVGDLAFYYHSVSEKQIVGIVKIVSETYPDETDPTGRFVVLDIEAIKGLENPVTLAEIKANDKLQNLALVRQSRLSIMPVSKEEWEALLKMADTEV